jgi:hypothetical protein
MACVTCLYDELTKREVRTFKMPFPLVTNRHLRHTRSYKCQATHTAYRMEGTSGRFEISSQ